MKRIFVLILVLGMGSSAFAQNVSRFVITSSGGELSSADGPGLSWTLGEISTEYIRNGMAIQQGFQQGNLDIVVGINQPSIPSSAWKAFPNPTDYYLQLETNFVDSWRYEIRDMLGRLVLFGKADQPELRIDLPFLKAGVYLVTVYQSNGLTASQKLLINQN